MIIRSEQIDDLRRQSRCSFEDELIKHVKTFSPRLSAVLGDEQLRVVIRKATDAARQHGFTHRGPIRLYIELVFLFGSSFDTDPQYPWAGQILRSFKSQSQRALHLHEATLEYYAEVVGSSSVNTRRALAALSSLADAPLPFTAEAFTSDILHELTRIYPEKASYVGANDLRTLIQKGILLATTHGFNSVRGLTLTVTLMFAFGHECSSDLLYPWIGATLNDPRIVDPPARAARLERKSRAWLRSVLAGTRVESEE